MLSQGGFYRNVQRYRGGLVFKSHRLVHHSTLGWRVIKKKKKSGIRVRGERGAGCRVQGALTSSLLSLQVLEGP